MEKVMQLDTLLVFQGSDGFLENLNDLETAPDIFLLDIQMEPINGFEMLQIIKTHKRFRKSKVIAITASVMGEEVDRLKESGFHGAISKPLNISAFPGLIGRILRNESVWFVS